MTKNSLNSADYGRIEAALRASLEDLPAEKYPKARRAWERTLDKIERINQTGEYTIQHGGMTLRESRRKHARAARKAVQA